MENQLYKEIIEEYIKAYNCFDIEGMLSNMDTTVKFENISNGQTTLTTNGIEELKKQAEQAKQYFKDRTQKITNFTFNNDQVEIEIDYVAILAIDFPNGLKVGDKIELKGKSIFKFKENKIIELKDIS